MKLLRIIVLAACAALWRDHWRRQPRPSHTDERPLAAAPAGLPVEHVQFPCVFPFNCGYGYYGVATTDAAIMAPLLWHRYYGHRYYGHRYYGRRYYGRRYR